MLRQHLVLALVLVLAVANEASAQLAPGQAAKIDSVFARYDRTDAPGCVLGVGANGKVLYHRGYGMASLEHPAPLTESSIVEIGSVSKQFTTASILLLAQDGKLSLDDDIRKWLPMLPDFGKKITVRMLANHTSGLRDQWGLLGLLGNGPGSQVHSNALIVDMITRQKDLNFPPNDQYLYSNTGFVLLATIVQRVSGQTLADFSTERIFKPLGMNNTQWRDDFERIVKGRAHAYAPGPNNMFRLDMPFTNVYGNGGLLTTVGDLLIWWDALMNNRLGQPGFTDAMTTRATLNNGKQIAYALGVSVDDMRGVREISHGGATAGYRAHLTAYPDEKTAIAVLCNRADALPANLSASVAEVVLKDRLGAVVATAPITRAPVSPAELATRTGLYRNRSTEELVQLEVLDNKLMTARGARVELIPIGNDVYRRANSPQEVRFTTVNGKTQLHMGTGIESPNIFEKIAPFTPSAAQLNEYAGTYVSPELDQRVDLVIENGVLSMKRRMQQTMRLEPTFKDGFSGNGFYVFTRNSAGKITGFRFTQGRVRHVWFERR